MIDHLTWLAVFKSVVILFLMTGLLVPSPLKWQYLYDLQKGFSA